ncbi:hypothetical protein [Amycolatopsis sp. NPDC051372]|uniref:hypothetical protein n=1 Tax=Amycolatopsis sp. NPDC051372 TaxID=3155669 RepID=UPI00343B93B5
MTEIAARTGREPTVEDLRGVSAAGLVAAADSVSGEMRARTGRWGAAAHAAVAFSPVVDGEVLPRIPFEALAAGAGRGIELVAGHTRDEGCSAGRATAWPRLRWPAAAAGLDR